MDMNIEQFSALAFKNGLTVEQAVAMIVSRKTRIDYDCKPLEDVKMRLDADFMSYAKQVSAAACEKFPLGLGDMVATAAEAVGITEQRVSAVVGKPCGCGERRQALNEMGRKLFGIGGSG